MLSHSSAGIGPYKSEKISRVEDCDKLESALLVSGVDCLNDPPKRSSVEFAVVEIDDQGDFHNPEHVYDVLEKLEMHSSARPVLLLTYIHGWRHNASEQSSDLVEFRKYVNHAANNLQDLDSDPNRYKMVFGIYISWRGDSLGLTKLTSNKFTRALQIPTFWNRLAAAKRISNTNTTNFLLSVSSRLKLGDQSRVNNRKNKQIAQHKRLPRDFKLTCLAAEFRGLAGKCSRSIVIGHSMGGRILENAVAQAMIGMRRQVAQILNDESISSLLRTMNTVSTRRSRLIEYRRELIRVSDNHLKIGKEPFIAKYESFNIQYGKDKEHLKRKLREYRSSLGHVSRAANEIENSLDPIYQPLFDLAILINPATDALSTKWLKNSLCDDDINLFVHNQRLPPIPPWLIAISSESDYATKYIYKFGSFFSSLFSFNFGKSLGNSSCVDVQGMTQKELTRNVATFLDVFQTHVIRSKPEREPECEYSDQQITGDHSIIDGIRNGIKIASNLDTPGCLNYIGKYGPNSNKLYMEVNRRKGVRSSMDDAYWLFTVPTQVVRNHNDIFTQNIGQLITVLYARTRNIRTFCRSYPRVPLCEILISSNLASRSMWFNEAEDQFELDNSKLQHKERSAALNVDMSDHLDSENDLDVLMPRACIYRAYYNSARRHSFQNEKCHSDLEEVSDKTKIGILLGCGSSMTLPQSCNAGPRY